MPNDWRATDSQLEYSKFIRTCWLTGCKSRAEYTPVLALSHDGKNYMHILQKLIVCAHHKEYLILDDFIGGKTVNSNGIFGNTWDNIVSVYILNGKEPPLREFSKLNWRLG